MVKKHALSIIYGLGEQMGELELVLVFPYMLFSLFVCGDKSNRCELIDTFWVFMALGFIDKVFPHHIFDKSFQKLPIWVVN